MPEQQAGSPPAVVTLPAEIDLTNADHAGDLLDAAFVAGSAVVIADFTGTTYCDCAAMRAVLTAGDRAAARGAELRLAIRPGTMAGHLADLLGLNRQIPIYPGPAQAAAGQPAVTMPGQTAEMAGISGAHATRPGQSTTGSRALTRPQPHRMTPCDVA